MGEEFGGVGSDDGGGLAPGEGGQDRGAEGSGEGAGHAFTCYEHCGGLTGGFGFGWGGRE